ncbi:MAG: transglycosylase domain-containing protein [Phycisphaerales bacterium]|nr:transglycosylase domain-containing protein [Phycisphaerales bacterium]
MKLPLPSRRLVKRTCIVAVTVMVMCAGAFAVLWMTCPLPEGMLSPGPHGSLVLDREDGVLLDVTGADQMRRLPVPLSDMGPWIPLALIAAEDARFHAHLGIDPVAVVSASLDNLASGRVVRGASTITMQVAGMKLGHPRTFRGKAIEGFRALQIEAAHDKNEILEAWLNMAPFGANITGIEAAARAWLGKPAAHCSLSEAALLVGLPKSPERLRPDRHPEAAMERRDAVLERMLQTKVITGEQYKAAIAQQPLLQDASTGSNQSHAGWMAKYKGAGTIEQTNIDPHLQEAAETIVHRHSDLLPDGIDVALLLVELDNGAVRALVGSSDPLDPLDGQINGVSRQRSPGSALKPFVYAAAFEQRRLSPDSLVLDAPIDIEGWRPRNIDRVWLGEMTTRDALRQSRNAPALRVGQELGLGHITALLRRCGMDLPLDSTRKAGLSIVVGGVECTPWSLAEAYATIARGGVHMPLRLLRDAPVLRQRAIGQDTCTAIEACLSPDPTEASALLPFMAAKTGTSSGHRDALAAGWNASWAAVVWVGRFDGGSDPVLLGADAALPILQDLLHHPSLATERPHRPMAQWAVARPVGRTVARRTEIIEPRNGDVILATNNQARITPVLESAGAHATLFLNGAPVAASTLQLEPGQHELRLVEQGSQPAVVQFTVERDR